MRLAGPAGTRTGRGTSLAARTRGRLAAAAILVATALAGTTMVGVPAASASSTETVIVTSTGLLSPVAAVLDVLGTVLTRFQIIDGVEASIPAALAPALDALPGITVTPDVSVSVQSTVESTGPHAPSDAFLQQTGATQLASAGDTGQGVTVAVLDTGIDRLPDFAGRLIGGVDLTGENDPFQDDYGHGTFVAGLIAGDGTSSDGQYYGEAPGADLVSIKVAGRGRHDRPGAADPGLAVGHPEPARLPHRCPQHVPGLPAVRRPPPSTRWTRPSRRPGTRASRSWPRPAMPGPSTAPSCRPVTTRW